MIIAMVHGVLMFVNICALCWGGIDNPFAWFGVFWCGLFCSIAGAQALGKKP